MKIFVKWKKRILRKLFKPIKKKRMINIPNNKKNHNKKNIKNNKNN